ncbi:hypothetical protein D3C77_668180 [compost metagenome]
MAVVAAGNLNQITPARHIVALGQGGSGQQQKQGGEEGETTRIQCAWSVLWGGGFRGHGGIHREDGDQENHSP